MRALFAALWTALAGATTTWTRGGNNEDCDTVCSRMSRICNEEALALVDDSDYFEGYVVEEEENGVANRADYDCSAVSQSSGFETAPYANDLEEGACFFHSSHSSGGGTCEASALGHYRFCPCDDQARRPAPPRSTPHPLTPPAPPPHADPLGARR